MCVFERVKTFDELAPFLVSSSSPSSTTTSTTTTSTTTTTTTLPSYIIRGRVCSRRELGKSMLFFDLVPVYIDSGDCIPSTIRLECLFHANGLSKLDRSFVKKHMHDLHLGDEVQVEGPFDTSRDHLILEPVSFTIVTSWKETHKPREGFLLDWDCEVAPPTTPLRDGEEQQEEEQQQEVQKEEGQLEGLDNLCKFWVTCQGRCLRIQKARRTKAKAGAGEGEENQNVGCDKYHPPLSRLQEYRTAWTEKRRQEKAVASQLEGDTHDPHDKTHKALRAEIFADWLVETYGKEKLSEGVGVVDVAGGRGDVSCRLWGKYGIPCTIVDPREVQLRKKKARQIVKERGSLEGIKRIRCAIPPLFLCSSLGIGNESEGGQEVVVVVGEKEEKEEQEEEETLEKLRQTLKDCSVVVGMHPDEATDVCFDAAFTFQKPVACVPCCVFSRDFPHRRKPGAAKTKKREEGQEQQQEGEEGEAEEDDDTNTVESYDDLIEYLLAKPCLDGSNIKKHFLPFAGKNQLLYTQAKAQAKATATADEE